MQASWESLASKARTIFDGLRGWIALPRPLSLRGRSNLQASKKVRHSSATQSVLNRSQHLGLREIQHLDARRERIAVDGDDTASGRPNGQGHVIDGQLSIDPLTRHAFAPVAQLGAQVMADIGNDILRICACRCAVRLREAFRFRIGLRVIGPVCRPRRNEGVHEMFREMSPRPNRVRARLGMKAG